MMRPLLSAWTALALSTLTVLAREATVPKSRISGAQPLASVPQLSLPVTDPLAELAADRRLGFSKGRVRIAADSQVNISPVTHGVWENVPGGQLWRLRIDAPGATDLNLGFSRFELSGGVTMHLIAEEEDYFQGAFTAKDSKAHSQLWTPMIPGSRLVIEVFVPEKDRMPELLLTQINRGYRDFFKRKKEFAAKAAGACENDVICPEGDPWRDEIRSVGVYTIFGVWYCSGTLMNNALGDRRNYFLTAAHCFDTQAEATSIVVYWNFESPTCGQHGGGSLAQNQSGSTLRATRADVDMTLIELDDVPDPGFRVYYSGWDRTGTAPVGCVGIHHPDTAEKSISFATQTLTTVNNCIGTGGVNSHWQVIWSDGVTEPGSSGSGIWNPANHRLVGFLSGGGSDCSAPTDPDCYGKFSVAWTGSSSATSLSNWLGSVSNSVTGVPGLDSISTFAQVKLVSTVIAAESCPPGNNAFDPGETITLNFTLTNSGNIVLSNVIGVLLPGTGVSLPSAPQSYGQMSTNSASVARSFTLVATGICNGFVTTRLLVSNGPVNLGTFTNTFQLGTPNIGASQNFDGVVAPALPAGWTTTTTNSGTAWVTSTTYRDTFPNTAFGAAPGLQGDSTFTSSSFSIVNTNAELVFKHRYDFENTYDGGVLELSIGSGPFADIITAGSVFLEGSYTQPISSGFGNTLGGRSAWSGLTSSFITTRVRLPNSVVGQSIRLRWRIGTDSSVGTTGWYVDSVAVNDGATCCSSLSAPQIVNLRRPANSIAFSFQSVAGQSYQVETRGTIGDGTNWQTLQSISGDGSVKHFTNTLATTNRFYRLRSP